VQRRGRKLLRCAIETKQAAVRAHPQVACRILKHCPENVASAAGRAEVSELHSVEAALRSALVASQVNLWRSWKMPLTPLWARPCSDPKRRIRMSSIKMPARSRDAAARARRLRPRPTHRGALARDAALHARLALRDPLSAGGARPAAGPVDREERPAPPPLLPHHRGGPAGAGVAAGRLGALSGRARRHRSTPLDGRGDFAPTGVYDAAPFPIGGDLCLQPAAPPTGRPFT